MIALLAYQGPENKRNYQLPVDGIEIFLFMVIIDSSSAVRTRFFAPLINLITQCDNQRSCPDLPDDDWMRIGIARVIPVALPRYLATI